MSRRPVPEFELSDEIKAEILREFQTTPDLMELTRKIFKDESLDGRCVQGRAIRKFLAHQNLNYETTFVEKVDEIKLTEEQRAFLMSENLEAGSNALEITRLVFNDTTIASLSAKHRTVNAFLRRFRPEIVSDDIVVGETWVPPKALSRAIKKVNDWVGTNYDEVTMPTKQKRMCERLIIYLRSPRFGNIINQYARSSDRDLFESEFVRIVWDKPDLTIDELNNYITVCANYIRQKHIQQRMDKLSAILSGIDNDERDITMRLTEIIKATSEELNQCEKRIETMIKDLNGSRQGRLKDKGEQSGNILALVEAFQDKEERDKMLKMAQLKNKLIEDEADRLESMDEFKARILGISKYELT